MKAKVVCTLLFVCAHLISYSQDLVVQGISAATSTFDRYESMSCNVTVENVGVIDVTKSFFTFLYLSKNDVLDDQDYRVGTGYTSSLKKGTPALVNPMAMYGLDIPPGNYYLIVKIDFYDDINETDEGRQNNRRVTLLVMTREDPKN